MKNSFAIFVLGVAFGLVAGNVEAEASSLLSGKTLGNGSGFMDSSSPNVGSGAQTLDTSAVGGGSVNYQSVKTTNVTPGADSAKADTAATTDDTAKADDAKKADAEKKCMAATKNAQNSGSAMAEKMQAQACVGVNYTEKNPEGASDARADTAAEDSKFDEYTKLGDAHAAMLNNQLTATTAPENLNKFTTLKVTNKPVDLNNVNQNLIGQNSILKSNTGLSGNFGGDAKVISSGDLKTIDAQKYRDANGKATVVIGGLGTGIDPNNPRGKAGTSVQWDNSLIKTDVETARATRFGQSDLTPGQTNYNGFNSSVAVPDSLKGMGLNSSQLEMAAYIDARGRDLGMSDTVRQTVIKDIMRESNFNTFNYPKSTGENGSSAYGLGQNLSGNWTDQFKDGTNGGVVMNRNNTVNQIDVLYGDVNSRYNTYSNSASLQSQYSFGQYDYINHYAGSLSAPQSRINEAVSYYNSTTGKGDKLAGYIMGGGTSDGTLIAGNTGATPGGGYSYGNGGIGNTVNQIASAITGGGSVNSIVGKLTSQFGMGNADATSLVNAALSGQLSQTDLLQVAAGYAISQAINKAGSGSSGSSGNSSSGGSSVKITQAVRDLAEQCGSDLPQTKDALMLMIKSCQS